MTAMPVRISAVGGVKQVLEQKAGGYKQEVTKILLLSLWVRALAVRQRTRQEEAKQEKQSGQDNPPKSDPTTTASYSAVYQEVPNVERVSRSNLRRQDLRAIKHHNVLTGTKNFTP